MSKLKSAICIVLACCLSQVHGQTLIYGKVVDNETMMGVSYAHVQIVNSTLGTACDENGDFVLAIFPVHYDASIEISSIGYTNETLLIRDIIDNFYINLIIRLNPFTQILDEVKISSMRTPPEVFLEEAIRAIPKNFIQQPFNMEFYSKMSVTDLNKTVLYRIESIMLTYKEGYVSNAYNVSKVVHMRETGVYPQVFHDYVKGPKEYFPYWAGLGITGLDQVGLGYSVFNAKNFKKMKFRYAGVSIFDKDTLIAIEYSNRKFNSEGIVYINTNNLAFIKHSYGIGNYQGEIIYKNINGYYFPYLIKSTGPVLNDDPFFIVDEISLRNVEIDNVVPLEQEHDHWFPAGVPFNEDFWNSNFPLKK